MSGSLFIETQCIIAFLASNCSWTVNNEHRTSGVSWLADTCIMMCHVCHCIEINLPNSFWLKTQISVTVLRCCDKHTWPLQQHVIVKCQSRPIWSSVHAWWCQCVIACWYAQVQSFMKTWCAERHVSEWSFTSQSTHNALDEPTSSSSCPVAQEP